MSGNSVSGNSVSGNGAAGDGNNGGMVPADEIYTPNVIQYDPGTGFPLDPNTGEVLDPETLMPIDENVRSDLEY